MTINKGKEMYWETISIKYQSGDLYVVEQLVKGNEIFAQLWKDDQGNYSLNTYDDSSLDGTEHYGKYVDLKKKAETFANK